MRAQDSNPFPEVEFDLPAGRPDRAPGTADGPLADLLDQVPGLASRHVSLAHGDDGSLVARVSFSGWSPSLHEVAIEAKARARDGREETAMHLLGPMLQRQCLRAAEAGRMCHRIPLSGVMGYSVLGHLHVDRALVDMREDDPTLLPIIGHLDRELKPLHRAPQAHDGGLVLTDRGGMVCEATGRDGRITRMIGAAVDIMPDGFLADRRPQAKKVPRFDGAMLTLPVASVPDTILHAMPGRRVGELVRVHRLLDDRVVNQARNSKDGKRVLLALEIDPVAIADL